MGKKLELWGVPESPFVRKVMNVLFFKKVEFIHHKILPQVLLEATGQKVPQAFLQASPLGKVPAMSFEGGTVADSAVIVAFLEKREPRYPVYPGEEKDFVRALWLEKYADTRMTEVVQRLFIEQVVKPFILKKASNEEKVQSLLTNELPGILSYLDNWLRQEKETFLVGGKLTIADFAVFNHLLSLQVAKVPWKNKGYSYLENYFDHMSNEKVISQAIPLF